MVKHHDRQYLCLSTNDRHLRTIQSCICGTGNEIESVIKKLILSKKQGKPIFWKRVIA